MGRKGKVALLAAVSVTAQGKPECVCLSPQPVTGDDVLAFALSSLKPDSLVVSDGAPSINYVRWGGANRHRAIVTGGGQQACEIAELKAINTVLGNPKTGIADTYHAFKFAKYSYWYLAEYEYRFNRRFDISLLTQRIVRALANTKPAPMRTLRLSEGLGGTTVRPGRMVDKFSGRMVDTQ